MGKVFVISGPSGAGKTTLCREVIRRVPGVRMSVSHTTRRPRAGEAEGIDYFFVDEPGFRRMIERGDFAEWAQVHKNLYGTSRAELERGLTGEDTLLVEIDTQGARSLKAAHVPAVFIFINPPDLTALETRLVNRHTDPPDAIRDRLDTARRELPEAHWYDYRLLNDRLDDTVERLVELVTGRETVPPAESGMASSAP